MSELDASLGTERVWKPNRIIRQSCDEKQKVYSSDYELKRLLSEESLNRTNLIIILVSGASAML